MAVAFAIRNIEDNLKFALPPGWGALLALVVVWLLVWLWIRMFLARCLTVLPEEHWNLRPWTSWFLLLPPINVFWNFYFLLNLSQAYRNAYEALGRSLPVRESGRTEALVYSVVFTLGWYPMNQGLLAVLWMGGLAALTIYLFKLHSLSQRFARIQLSS